MLTEQMIGSEPFRPILTKTQFVKMYQLGCFGNASPTWNTFEEFDAFTRGMTYFEACYGRQKYHLRNRIAGGPTHYNLSAYQAFAIWCQFWHNKDPNWYCSEMAPTEKTLIQGEVMRTHLGLEMFYSFVKKPMRQSLDEGGVTARGVTVKVLLEHYMNTASYEWLQVLLDRYPDHVIEFSVYDCCWGTVPGHNSVFWECRLY